MRLALVITGVGNPKAHEGAEWMRTPHGVLKEMVPRWLNEQDFAASDLGMGPRPSRVMAATARCMSICGGHGPKLRSDRSWERHEQAFHTDPRLDSWPGPL